MENFTNRKPPVIFIADDDEDDVSFVKAAFDELKAHVSLKHFYNGKELMNELNHTGDSPDLFILDLNMPILDGRETLRQIRERIQFTQTPVVILSTSNQPNERFHCAKLGANEYISKPYHYSSYIDIMRDLKARWLDQVTV